jgi:hypothetical protein
MPDSFVRKETKTKKVGPPSGVVFGNAMPQIGQGADSFCPNFFQGTQVRLVDVSKIENTQPI